MFAELMEVVDILNISLLKVRDVIFEIVVQIPREHVLLGIGRQLGQITLFLILHLLLKQIRENLRVLDVAVAHDLFGIAHDLIRALPAPVIVGLLDQHTLLVISLDRVFEVVPVVLRGNRAVSLLDRLVHETILIHVVSEGLVSSGDYEDSQLGISPLIVVDRLLKRGRFEFLG